MRHRKLVSLAAATILLFAAGCGSGETSSEAPEPTTGTGSTSSASSISSTEITPAKAAAGNPCDDSRGPCEVVASVDVDGDGYADNVGIELIDGSIDVHIDTGDGVSTASVTDQHVIRQDITPSAVFVGAFHITRAEGADIVVDAKFGLGGAELFGVIGWDDGPVVVPAPPGAVYPESLPTEWAVPTERLRVLVRCPAPGSVGVVKTEADISYGVPTPGGAYTETVTSDWSGGSWSIADTTRVPGQYVSENRSAKTGTFECEPVHDAPPAFAPTASDVDPNLVFGGTAPPNSKGYGETTPAVIYFGGSPSGFVGDIVWESWGGERAVGQGTALYVVDSVADAESIPAEVVVYDITTCNGKPAYSKVQWYFPSMGEAFDPARGSGGGC